jgi:serine/threonine-protein kinase HipA
MLAVLHACGRVGSLRAVGRELEFAYDGEWLAQKTAFPLSPRLAMREEPWLGEEVLFFFANLLPEGGVLDTLCRLRRLPRGNVLRLLEAFGRECAGAFEIVPEQEVRKAQARKPEYVAYSTAELAADLAKVRNNIPLLQSHRELRLSLAGAQNKIPLRYAQGKLFLPVDGAPSTHILKAALQPQSQFPDAVLNEAFCLRLAAALGMTVPDVLVLTDPEPVLLIGRYDRVINGDRIDRLHQLDLCQLAGVLPDQKYESDGGPGFKDCFAQIDLHSALPAADRLRLVDWVICNYLIGNADAHAKNLSMLYASDGRLRLAPAYDLRALKYWPDLSDKMAMAIGSERRPAWVQTRHWQSFCEEIGLNVTQLRRRARGLCALAATKYPDILAALDASTKFTRHIATMLGQRTGWIDQRLGNAAGTTA